LLAQICLDFLNEVWPSLWEVGDSYSADASNELLLNLRVGALIQATH
jgi:hypothetical protein